MTVGTLGGEWRRVRDCTKHVPVLRPSDSLKAAQTAVLPFCRGFGLRGFPQVTLSQARNRAWEMRRNQPAEPAGSQLPTTEAQRGALVPSPPPHGLRTGNHTNTLNVSGTGVNKFAPPSET